MGDNILTAKQQLNLIVSIFVTLTTLAIIFHEYIHLLKSVSFSVSASPFIIVGFLLIYLSILVYVPLSRLLSSGLFYDKVYKCFRFNRSGQIYYLQTFSNTINELILTNTVSSLSDASDLIDKVSGQKQIVFENAPLNIFLKGSLNEFVRTDYKEHLVIPTLNLLHQKYDLFPDISEINKDNYPTICRLYHDYFWDNTYFNEKTGIGYSLKDTQALLYASEDAIKELPYFKGLGLKWDFVDLTLNHLKEKDCN